MYTSCARLPALSGHGCIDLKQNHTVFQVVQGFQSCQGSLKEQAQHRNLYYTLSRDITSEPALTQLTDESEDPRNMPSCT